MHVLVELAFTYQTIVALSATHQSNYQSAHCHLQIYILFYWGFVPHQEEYVEQVEKSFP